MFLYKSIPSQPCWIPNLKENKKNKTLDLVIFLFIKKIRKLQLNLLKARKNSYINRNIMDWTIKYVIIFKLRKNHNELSYRYKGNITQSPSKGLKLSWEKKKIKIMFL